MTPQWKGWRVFNDCPRCEGRGYVMPSILATPETDGKPPRTQWCRDCNGKGLVLTKEALAVLRLVRGNFWNAGYKDEYGELVGDTFVEPGLLVGPGVLVEDTFAEPEPSAAEA